MNIIVILEKDAANVSLSKIALAFLEQGDTVKIYAPIYNDRVLEVFNRFRVYKLQDLQQEDIEWCNLIYCSTLSSTYLPISVFFAHKPIYTHNYLLNRQINWGGDLCFAPSQRTVQSDYDEYLYYSYIGIGEPKYDDITYTPNSDNKNFLFIDSGHFPFSYEGKKEIARVLLKICADYSDYQLVVKPRFLPGDKMITHRNDIDLYDVIKLESNGVIPENMKLLYTHENLDELINRSSTVICMYSTAFVGAVMAGKGLVILDNLPTRDVYDIRNKTYMRNRENMLESGALVDYHDVFEVLPYGIKSSDKYIDFLLDERENSAKKIVEVCHYLNDSYYEKGLFPRFVNTTYKKYLTEYVLDDQMTWEEQITRRCCDYILLKSLILIDFHVNSKLNIESVTKEIKRFLSEDGFISERKFEIFLRNSTILRDKCIMMNGEIMLEDNIDAGILLNAYYLLQEYDKIRSFPLKNIAAYNMFRAYTAIDTNEADASTIAEENLVIYFEKCMFRKYNQEISDMPNNKFKAFIMLIDILKSRNEVEQVIYYVEKLRDFYFQNYSVINDLMEIENQLQKDRYEYILRVEDWIQRKA